MPLPELSDQGVLPAGIYIGTLDELRERFGKYKRNEAHPKLFSRLSAFLSDVERLGFVLAVIVDGSFVTAKQEPEDVDLILVVEANHDFMAVLRPCEYNCVSAS